MRDTVKGQSHGIRDIPYLDIYHTSLKKILLSMS